MKELGPIRTGLLCCLGSLGAGILLTELLGLPEIVCSAEKYVYHRRDTEENIRPDAVPQN